MKIEINIPAPVLNNEKMKKYIILFAHMLLLGEGETIDAFIDGEEIKNLYL